MDDADRTAQLAAQLGIRVQRERTALAAELRRLAAANRAEAARYAGMSPPHYTGVNLLAEARAYEHAAVLVEQTLGGER